MDMFVGQEIHPVCSEEGYWKKESYKKVIALKRRLKFKKTTISLNRLEEIYIIESHNGKSFY